MKIIFMGTPEFAVPSLKILLESHHEISAVVTVPDKPRGRGLKLSESDIKKFALEKNLKIFQPEKLKDEKFIEKIIEINPDLIIVVAFRILPKEIYTIPHFGSFNLHASLLPKYRGAAPINWAIINGEKETGVTTFFLKEKVDTGNIVLQNKCEIYLEDDAGSLHDKLSDLGSKTVMSTVNLIEMTNGNPPVYEQDNNLSSPAPKITKEFCKVNWNNDPLNVHNFIRGLSPYPTAYTFLDGKLIKIFKTRISEKENYVNEIDCGKVFVEDNRIYVVCKNGCLELLSLQMEGKKRLNASEFLNGFKFFDNSIFR